MSVYRQARTSAGSCPRCMEPLAPNATVPNVRVCERCGGVFADIVASNRIFDSLDRALLGVAFGAARGKERMKDDGRFLTCPECQLQMTKNHVDNAKCTVDACPVHGTWFDAEEMIDVMRALDRARRKGIIQTASRPSLPVNLSTTPERARSVSEMLVAMVTDWLGPRPG